MARMGTRRFQIRAGHALRNGRHMPAKKARTRKPRTTKSVRKAHRSQADRTSRADSLATYRKKRRFDVTNEPGPDVPHRKSSKALEFVVQKHDATRLHYDHRIEIDGAMMS